MKNWQKYKVINYILLLFLASCFEEYSKFEFSYPNRSSIPETDGEINITILYNNNFQSTHSGVKESYPENSEITVGGSNLFANYIQTLRSKFKDTILLDTGNMISRDTSIDSIKKTLNLYEKLSFDAVLLSENEILNIPKETTTSIPFISSNIIDIKKEIETDFLGNTTYIIKEVGGIKFALIGLTLYKEDLNISGVIFDDPVARIINTISQIKESVDFKVLLIHPQTNCLSYQECNLISKEFEHTLNRLPPHIVDLIVGGELTNGKSEINDFKVAQNYGRGQFLGLIQLSFDKDKKILKDGINILQPLKICSHFFDATADCHLQKGDSAKLKLLQESKYKLIKPRVLGINL